MLIMTNGVALLCIAYTKDLYSTIGRENNDD
jgi:hypothetical protein